jgi:biotin transport system substrate-specific component
MAQMHTAGTVAAEPNFQAPAVQTPAVHSQTTPLIRQTALAIAGSLLVAICAHISVPLFFTPVPLTMQNFAVILLGLLLEPATVFASMALYLVEGASGLPVFTPHGAGGLLQLLGPSGGFLLAYPFVAAFVSILSRRIRPVNFTSLAFSAAAGSIFLYACGAAWFSLAHLWLASAFNLHPSLATTLKMTILPFLPGDALKVLAAASIAIGATKYRNRIKA